MKKALSALLLALSTTTFASSWQTIVDDRLVGSGMCTGAAIFDFAGNTYALKNLRVDVQEANVLMEYYSNPSAALAQGLTVSGVNYPTVKADSSTLAGRNTQEFVWISKTHTVNVICKGNIQHMGPGAVVTETVAEYLKDQGY